MTSLAARGLGGIGERSGRLAELGEIASFVEARPALVADRARRRSTGRAGRARAVAELDRPVEAMEGDAC